MSVLEKIEPAAASSLVPDDMELLRAAVELTRDISAARPGIYWPDMLLSAALGYGALAGAIMPRTGQWRWPARWSRCSRCTVRCCSSTS